MRKIIYLLSLFTFAFLSSRSSTYYWVNNGGNWSDFSNHWATTSGGSVFYNQPPTANDDVIFDVNSFSLTNQIVLFDNGIFFCKDLTWSGVNHSPSFGDVGNFNFFSTTLKVYGSISLDNSMIFGYQGLLSCESGLQTNTIKGVTSSFIFGMRFNNPAGVWTLTDSLITRSIEFIAGTFITNNNYVESGQMYCSQNTPKTIDLGNSVVNAGYWASNGTNIMLDADSCTIVLNEFNAEPGQQFKKIVVEQYSGNPATIWASNTAIDSLIGVQGLRIRQVGTNIMIKYFKSFIPVELTMDTIQYAEFHSSATLLNSIVFDTLALYNGGQATILPGGPGQITTVNNALLTDTSSCAGFVNIKSANEGQAATINLGMPTATINKATIKDIVVNGGIINAINSIDLGNVNGVVFSAPVSRTLYWVHGSGSWDDASHWSFTSGGTGGDCVPSQLDSVVFDQNSLSPIADTLILPSGSSCGAFNASQLTDSLLVYGTDWYSEFNLYGSFVLSPQVTWNNPSIIQFLTTTTNHNIAVAGNYLREIHFFGSGSWTLQDSLKSDYMLLNSGTLNTNSKTVRSYVLVFEPLAPLTINMDSSLMFCHNCELDGLYTLNGPNGTFAGSSVTANATGTLNIGKLIAVFGGSYPSHTITNATIGTYWGFERVVTSFYNCNIQNAVFDKQTILYSDAPFGNMHFKHDFNLNSNVTADTVFLENPGYTGKFYDDWNMNYLKANYDSCDAYSKLISNGTGLLSIPSGTINVNNIILNNVHAQGGATFNAIDGLNEANVSGWNFIGAPQDTTLYWVNGTGNWSDYSHWSYTSGGTPIGCTPSPLANVIFDENSFAGNDTVYADVNNINCKNMIWQNIIYHPVLKEKVDNSSAIFYNYSLAAININGNLVLDSNVISNYDSRIKINGNNNPQIVTAGVHIKRLQISSPSGTRVDIINDLNAGTIEHLSGTLYTNNNSIETFSMNVNDSLFAGTSLIKTYAFTSNVTDNKIVAENAEIIIEDAFNASSGNLFGKVKILGETSNSGWVEGNDYRIKELTTLGEAELYNTNNLQIDKLNTIGAFFIHGYNTRIGFAKIDNQITINNNTVFDTLLLNNSGFDLKIKADSTVTVNNKFYTNSTSSNNIFIHSDQSGAFANLACNGDTVCTEYMSIQDIHTSGTAPFYAGQYSTDISGNNGVSFTPCVLPFSDVWPGDANRDGVVDNVDMLNIGLAYNELGYVRAGADMSWTAQSSQDWNRIFSNLVNIKHADCDGNGIINADDTLAVSQNYSLAHAFLSNAGLDSEQRSIGIDLYLNPASVNVQANQLVSIPIDLGRSISPANDIYGLAYKLNYDNTKIVPGSVSITYPSSWFTPNGNRLPFSKNFFTSGRLDNAQSRVDLTNANGFGTIAYLNFEVASGATGTINLDLSNILANDRNGNQISVTGNNITLTIGAAVGIQSIEQQTLVQVYPNPTEANTFISYQLTEAKNVSIEVFDVLGNKVLSEKYGQKSKGNHREEVITEKLPIGVYEIIIYFDNTRRINKMVKIK